MRQCVMVMAAVYLGCTTHPMPTLVEHADAALAGNPGDSGTLPDGAVASDAGRLDAGRVDAGVRVDAGMCIPADVWRQEERPMTQVELLSDAPRAMGVTERLRVTVILAGACDQLPVVRAAVSPGGATDFVTLTAWAFTRDRDCPPQTRMVDVLVDIPGTQQGNPNVRVMFGAQLFTYQRQLCMGDTCLCTASTPRGNRNAGDSCASDCECRAGFSCLFPAQGMTARCAVPCKDALDCLPRSTRCREQPRTAPPMTCDLQETGCNNNGDCPEGFVCDSSGGGGRRCVDRRPFPGQDCACVGDCDPLDTCILDVHQRLTCQRLCNRNEDCPLGVFVCSGNICRLLE